MAKSNNNDVFPIETIVTHSRQMTNCHTTGVNTCNSVSLREKSRWRGDKCQCHVTKYRKSDELLCVAQMNDVSCVCVTETRFKVFMSPEYVGLAGYCCERKDREDRGGGGVACYVATSMVYTRLRYIEDDEHEMLWVRPRPQKLPRKYSCIIIACIYHPPKADNGSMRA